MNSNALAWTVEHEKTDKCSDPDCQHKSVWRCLTQDCLYIGCSRSDGAHARTHNETTNHPITVNLNWAAWCYGCDSWVGSRVLDLKKLAQEGLTTKHLKINQETISEANWCCIS